MTDPAYREFEILVSNFKQDTTGERRFNVEVLRSPAGEGEPVARKIPFDVGLQLGKLERRALDIPALIALGEALADLLLPDRLRNLFVRSLDLLENDQGLRLRLRLPSGLADLPWEYMYIPRAGDGKASDKDVTGFLGLDPRLSIVRHERLPASGDFDLTPRPRRILAAMASPATGYEELNLEREKSELSAILGGVAGLQLDLWEHAQPGDLANRLAAGVDIFHFAGHGDFDAKMGEIPLSVQGQGALIFEGNNQEPMPIPADQIAANLSGSGAQLVVLGACLTARRDGQNRWSGVVAALMEVGIPAALAMQYKISDRAAIQFMTGFYTALAAGFPLDRAVTTGRLAVFNDLHSLRDDPERGRLWRDWGVPTLYLRADQDFRLTAIMDEKERQKVEETLATTVRQRIDRIGPQGVYKAVEAGVIKSGSIESYLNVKQMEGQVVQVDIDTLEGGNIQVEGEAETVSGTWIGVKAGTIGGPSTTQTTPAIDITCPTCQATNQAGAIFCTQCGSALKQKAKFCPNCGNPLTPDSIYCANCGTKVA